MHNKTNVHHNIPISLRGIDHDANKYVIDAQDHVLLHKKQNISHNLLRKTRSSLNNTLMFTPNKLWKIHNLQRKYFKWIDSLPDRMIIPQTDSLTRMIAYREYQIKSIIGMLPDDQEYSIDDSWKQPPELWKRNEIIDENTQKLEMLFEVEKERSRKQIEYIKKVYWL